MFVFIRRENQYAYVMISEQNKKILDEIGSRIARTRKARGISQESLAAKTGLDRVAIGYIEQGRRRPSVSTVVKITKALGMKLEEFFRGM